MVTKKTQDIVGAETGPDLLQVVETLYHESGSGDQHYTDSDFAYHQHASQPPARGRAGATTSCLQLFAEAAHRKCERGNKPGKQTGEHGNRQREQQDMRIHLHANETRHVGRRYGYDRFRHHHAD